MALCINSAAQATEGGGSLYSPGIYNDFSAGVFGPTGLYFRNDFFPNHGDISRVPIGGRLFHDVDQRVWANTLKFSVRTDATILSARYGAALSVPIILHQRANGLPQTDSSQNRERDDGAGLGDVYLAPIQLNWRWNNHHLLLSEGIFAPTGSYDRDRVINLGRNYWGFDTTLTYTWLHEQRGHEVSLTAGYLVNTKNDDTGYRSGNEFHFDYLVAQHFSPRFALGIPGYWYKQVSDDHARVLRTFNLGGFRSGAAGVGLALLFTPKIAGKEVNFILKWLHDVHATRRLEGSQIMFSVALKLRPWSNASVTSSGAGHTTRRETSDYGRPFSVP